MTRQKITFFRFLKTLFVRLLSGRVHFSKEYAGKTLLMEDGRKFQVIRDLKIDQKQSPGKSAAVFKVHFKFSGLSLAANKRLSVIPAPFLMAQPGFLRKIWCVSEDGYFQGIYQWASEEFAETYPQSFIFKLMTKRSAKDTLSYKVIPGTIISEYVESFLIK